MISEMPKSVDDLEEVKFRESVAEGKMRLTTNGLGWENLYLSEYALDFVKAIKELPGKPRVADLGCAYGYSTLQLLDQTHANVIANDIHANHLAELECRVPEMDRQRLILLPGNALYVNIEENSLDGLLALRWLHFLRPDEIRLAFTSFAHWLKPGGWLCVTANTPWFIGAVKMNFPAMFAERVARKEEWPGVLDETTAHCFVKPIEIDHGYLFDTTVLAREVELAGFMLVKVSYMSLAAVNESVANSIGGNENVGILAVKKAK